MNPKPLSSFQVFSFPSIRGSMRKAARYKVANYHVIRDLKGSPETPPPYVTAFRFYAWLVLPARSGCWLESVRVQIGSPTQTVLRTGNLGSSSCRARPYRLRWALSRKNSNPLACLPNQIAPNLAFQLACLNSKRI